MVTIRALLILLVLIFGLGCVVGWTAAIWLRYQPEHERGEELRLKWTQMKSTHAAVRTMTTEER